MDIKQLINDCIKELNSNLKSLYFDSQEGYNADKEILSLNSKIEVLEDLLKKIEKL